ncbi:hypothetical protein ACLOJK_034101 [Asimina triloba]
MRRRRGREGGKVPNDGCGWQSSAARANSDAMEADILEELSIAEAELQDVQGISPLITLIPILIPNRLSALAYIGLCVLVFDQIQILLDRQQKLYDRQSELQSLLEQYQALGSPANGAVVLEDWSGTFEWDTRADDVKFNVFGITSYRANQRETLNFNELWVPSDGSLIQKRA